MAMQTQSQSSYTLRRGRDTERGQTIVIALLVLLLLAFLGGLFASIVTRNLSNAGRAVRVQTADYYAESGVRFADEQLTFSTDGADWRPPLQYKLANGPSDKLEALRYAAATNGMGLASTSDPDKQYLDLGFTRYNIGGGRFLLRVSYDPAGVSIAANPTQGSAYSDPLTRYIKIESIGREGTVDPQDPTTYTSQANRLNATLIQYKAIGITDYARFVTNPDKRSDVMSLGVASQFDSTNTNSIITPGVFDFNGAPAALKAYPIITTYGAPDAFAGPVTGPFLPGTVAAPGTNPGGGSIRVNGSVRFYGANNIYLNYKSTASGYLNDTVQIAGNLVLDNYTPGTTAANDLTAQDASVTLIGSGAAGPVYPSNDTLNGFDTYGGAVRDASHTNDTNGAPRNVNRLEPPTLDSVNPATNLTRYRAITENSPARASVTPGGKAQYGYGQAIYVDNSNDIQQESSSLVGGYTLIDEWLHRTDAGQSPGSKFGWTASFYRPPGVDITLGRQIINKAGVATTFYGVRLTRSDVDGAGNLVGWKAPSGNSLAADYPTTATAPDGTTQTTMTVPYADMNASNDPTTVPAANPALASYLANPNNDVIIYAEGNVRIRGTVSADPNEPAGNATADDKYPRHVTIVTNGTAYIDGSLLRGNAQSSIQVLAHDYVCVNTTQFLAGAIVDQNPLGTTQPGAFAGDPTLQALDFGASDEELLQEFTLTGPAPSATAQQPYLYISGGPSAAGATAADFDIIDPQTGESVGTVNPPFTNVQSYAINTPPTPNIPFYAQLGTAGIPGLDPNTFVSQTGIVRTTFNLGTSVLANATESHPYQLAIRRDPGSNLANPVDTQDFLLERAAILPMEIRIEAGLFAQTRSFFVIPGDWFNPKSDDNVQAYSSGGGTTRLGNSVGTDDNRFPFFGQPIDMKITIDGSVAEAVPADISAQTAWMLKWGWVPQYHGGLVGNGGQSQFTGAGVPGIGLNIVYNPLAGFPYYTDHYLRMDAFGRPLPYAPKLPVCTGLLYAGQNTGESVLQ